MLAPVLLLVLVELLLRLGGFGYPTSFFLDAERGNQRILTENARFGWRFFPHPLARAPRPIVLPADKAPGTCRIFVFGESAAMGDPEPAYGFPRVLETLLKARFPDKKIEVVNAAMTAINSHVILPIARECAGLRGDVWVIYMGNNEVMGPFGPGTIFGARSPSRTLLRASLALKTTRIGQLVEEAVAKAGLGRPAPPRWGGMEMFLKEQLRQDDARLAAVYERFRQNLSDLLHAGVESGVKVVICTVVSNLKDCAPLGSLHRKNLTDTEQARWEKFYQAGSQFEAAGKTSDALVALQNAEQIDPSYADLQFRLARCCQVTGQFAEAKRRFELARDLDTLRFRCDSKLNQVIREVAAKRTGEGIYLIDAVDEFARRSPHGITGGEFLLEHVHFRYDGNYLLAGKVAQEIAQAFPSSAGSGERPWPSSSECGRFLALTGWNHYQIIDRVRRRLDNPPFVHQLDHAQVRQRLQTQLTEWQSFLEPRALPAWSQMFGQAIARVPDDWELHSQFAKLLEAFGETEFAVQEWRRVARLVPQYAVVHFELGRLLNRGAERSEARQHLLEALRLWPYFPEALNSLGIVLAHEKKFDDACRQFARAIALQPDAVEAQVNWAMALAAQGRPAEALAHYSQAVRLQPENAETHLKLGAELSRQGKLNEAAAQFTETVRLKPDLPAAHFNLGVVREKQSRISQAVEEFRETLRRDPTNQAARDSLARAQALLKTQPQP